MKKLFENTTAYNPSIYKDFVIFHNKKYTLKYNLYTLFILLLLSFCIVCQAIYGNSILATCFVLVTIIFLFWRVFYPFFFVKREANSKKITKQLKNTYSFYNNYIEIKNKNAYIKLKYYKLYKVFSTEKYFYLYVNKNYSYILDKNNFSIGNANDFYKFIRKKLWYKIF